MAAKSWWATGAFGLALLSGCANGAAGGDHVVDGSVPPLDDAALLDDASPPPDAAEAPDAAPTLGMSWPDDQVFPSFAPVAPLDVIEIVGRPADQITLLVTLEGTINRKQPRVYVPEGDGSSDWLWLDELGVARNMVANPFALVAKYRSEIAGIVIYDEAQPDTLNLATTIAGLKDGIVASPGLAASLTAVPYQLPVIADLRSLHFTSKLQIYQYQLDHYGAEASKRLIIGLTPAIPGHLRDYAVATRAMTVWLDPLVSAEKEMMKQYLARLSHNSPYMGWWTDEGAGVHLAATYGVPVYAADWSSNLTVLGGSPRGGATVPRAPAPPPLENKVYVAIFMSDGDNLQECEHLIPLKWSRPERGRAPTAWTVNPALVDTAPVILRYYQRTATMNDVLVSGPSGLGYTYPMAWPAGAFESYAKVSGKYMDAAGLRIVTLWNDRAELSDADAHAYAQHIPGLQGLTIQDTATKLRWIDNGVPLARMDLSYGDTEAILASGVDSGLQSYTGAGPVFLTVQGNMNMGTIHPGAFAELLARYGNNTNIVFVRPDHFFHLLTEANRPAQHRLLSGDFDWNGKTDQLLYYGGNGDFWMGLSTGTELVWHRAAQTPTFGNLLDGQHGLHTGDFDGDGKTDVAVYQASNDHWRIGLSDGNVLTWSDAGAGVGNLLDGRRRLSVGDYSGDGKDDLLVYDRGDGSFRVGVSNGASFAWHLAASTGGFGNLLDGAHVFYDGDWNGDGKRDVMFHYNGDHSWWMGLSDGNAITWHNASSTGNFGNLVDRSHRVLVGDWNADHKTDLAFHYNGNGDWWFGISDGNTITWSRAGSSSGMGDLLDWGHRLFVVDDDGNGKADILAYDGGSGKWWRGLSDGQTLAWQDLDQTTSFGDLADPSHALFFGDYDGLAGSEALFYYNGDGNWWLRSAGTWHMVSNTTGFGDLLH